MAREFGQSLTAVSGREITHLKPDMTRNMIEDDFLNLVRDFEDEDSGAVMGEPSPTPSDPGHRTLRRRSSITIAFNMMVDILKKSSSSRNSFNSVNTVSLEDDEDQKKLSTSKKINKKLKRVAWFSRLDRTIRKRVKTNKVLPQ